MTNVYTEWVNVVHFCNSWSIWFILAGGGGPPPWTTSPPPLDPLPPSPLRSSNALGGGGGSTDPKMVVWSMDFVRARGAGDFVLGIRQGVNFCFHHMCFYSKYSDF